MFVAVTTHRKIYDGLPKGVTFFVCSCMFAHRKINTNVMLQQKVTISTSRVC